MANYHITGPESGIRKMIKSCARQKVFMINGGKGQMWVSGGDHGWARNLCGDFGLNFAPVQSLPEYETADCGAHMLNLQQHNANCNSCRRLHGLPNKQESMRARKAGETSSNGREEANPSVTVVSAPGLGEFSLVGMLDLMRERMETAMVLAADYEAAITSVERLLESQNRLKELEVQIEKDRQASAFFWKESQPAPAGV